MANVNEQGVTLPKIDRLKVNMTYRCDRVCPNCNRATAVCPADSSDDIDPDAFAKTLESCAKAGKYFKSIWFTGGEPTMHPRFLDVIGAAAWYRKKIYPKVDLLMYTYHREKTWHLAEKALIDFAPFNIADTSKAAPAKHLFAAQEAPIDSQGTAKLPFWKGCWVSRKCGICLDWRGFWVCPIGAGITRAFNMPTKIIDGQSLSLEGLIAQYGDMCKLCGYFTFARPGDKDKDQLSPSWMKAVEEFNERRRSRLSARTTP